MSAAYMPQRWSTTQRQAFHEEIKAAASNAQGSSRRQTAQRAHLTKSTAPCMIRPQASRPGSQWRAFSSSSSEIRNKATDLDPSAGQPPPTEGSAAWVARGTAESAARYVKRRRRPQTGAIRGIREMLEMCDRRDRQRNFSRILYITVWPSLESAKFMIS